MTTSERIISADDYRRRRDRLGFTGRGFARFLRAGERSERQWSGGDRAVPGPVVAMLELLEAAELTAEQAQALVGRK